MNKNTPKTKKAQIQFGILLIAFLVLTSYTSLGQVNIVNGEQFNTNPVPTIPAVWIAGSWSLNYNYATNCHNAASETQTAEIAGGTFNSYFWIPVTFQNGYKYDVSIWRKFAKDMKIVFNTTSSPTVPAPLSTQTVVNATTTWQNIVFSSYVHASATISGYIGICVINDGGSSKLYVDDITVIETPPTCTYPTINSTLNAFSTVGENSLTVNWTRGNGNKCLVVAKASASVLTQPADAGNYTANASFGGGSQIGTGNYVVYNGTGSSVTVTNLDPGVTFDFYVYEFNTTGPCYKVPGVTSSQATNACTNYYVNDNSLTGDLFSTAVGNNAKSGKLPSKPKLSLSNLLSSGYTFNIGDTIFIDSGTYNNEENINFTTSGITFLGAGNSQTIIDDQFAGTATNYFMYVTGSNVTFKNMTIKGYENNGSQTPGHSGQALTIGGSATGILIENVILSSNGASGGNPSIVVLANTSVTIKGGGGLCNTWHTAYTGGIEAYGNGITLNIIDYILAYNFKTGSYYGGGLFINNANSTTVVNVTNTRFYNNDAADGGGIGQSGGVLNVTDCIIDANVAGQTAANVYGGGVRMTGGTATYTRTRFINNTYSNAGATLHGGGIGLYSLDANIDLTLDNCYFAGNIATEGDDIYADKFSGNTINVHATNTTFSSSIDAIYNKDADHIHLSNCGDPFIAGTNSPSVTKDNTTAPSSIPTPNPQNIVSGSCASNNIILPVELSSFNGMCLKNKIELYWKTASETNNDYFIIEKSNNGIEFIKIGTLNGNGNSNTLKNYIFIDSENLNINNFYRLTQVDFDGKFSQSEIISVSNSCNEIGFEFSNAYYNSSNNEISLSFLASLSGNINISITDILGRDIYNNIIEVQEGINNNNIQLNSVSNSIYIVSLYNEEFRLHKKIYVNIN